MSKTYEAFKPAKRSPRQVWVVVCPKGNVLGASRFMRDAVDESADETGARLPIDVVLFFDAQIKNTKNPKALPVHRYEKNGYMLTLATPRWDEVST